MSNKHFKVKAPEIDALREISNLITNKAPHPLDKYEIAATLESIGWNDNMAKEKFGQENIFSLSESIWDFLPKELDSLPAEPYENKLAFRNYLSQLFKGFLRGINLASPIAISAVAVLTLRFFLWTPTDYSQSLAASISLWAILAFIAVGGFTQALARRGLSYRDENPVCSARRTAYYFTKLGLIFTAGAAAYFFLLNWLLPLYPSASLIILYFLFLCVIWLTVTLMYILRRELSVTGLLAGGIVLFLALAVLFKLNIVVSQLISLGGLSIAGYLTAKNYYRQEEEKIGKGAPRSWPLPSFMLYSTLPYFKYGFFYYLFLNIDRIMAWSTQLTHLPYPISFWGGYESGLDFALFALILPMGLAEAISGDMMLKLSADQRNYSLKEMSLLNRLHKSLYQKRVYLMSFLCLCNGIILYFCLTILKSSKIIPFNVLSTPVTHFVLVIAIISYSILSLGLMNSLILFSHSQPRLAGNAFAIASIVNIGVGFVLSRSVAYSWAVFGLLGGSVIFWLLTTRAVLKVFSDLQYHLYRAQ